MSLGLFAANAPSLGDWVGNNLTPRFDLGTNSFPKLITRQNVTGSVPTINMFIDAKDGSLEYAASIVTACKDQTVYALQCTSGNVGSRTCGPNGAIATVTANPTKYELSSAVTTTTMGVEVKATVQETCTLAGTTAATCTATIKGEAAGTSTATSSSATAFGTDYYRFDVAITAGAEKIASATGTCKSAAVARIDSKNIVMWTLAAVAGASGVLAML